VSDDVSLMALSIGRCLDTPELSASMIVDSSAESNGPGEGVRNVYPRNRMRDTQAMVK